MNRIGNIIAMVFLSVLVVWFCAMILPSDKCTRIHRSAWPVIYGMGAVEVLTRNWTSSEFQLKLLLWKAKGAVGVQSIVERTFYGKELNCPK